jgi:hypothetical protein
MSNCLSRRLGAGSRMNARGSRGDRLGTVRKDRRVGNLRARLKKATEPFGLLLIRDPEPAAALSWPQVLETL